MSEAPVEGGNNSGETPAADEFTPITSQDDLNRIITERVKRVEGKYADYKDVKAKATRLDEIEKASQTETERAQSRIAELEAELTGVRTESTRLRIAAEHGITDADDIALFLTGADEETLAKQAQRLSERTADRAKSGNRVPREGANPTAPEDKARATVRDLFQG